MDKFDKQAHRPLAKEIQEPVIEQVPTDFLSFLASTKQNEFELLDTITFIYNASIKSFILVSLQKISKK